MNTAEENQKKTENLNSPGQQDISGKQNASGMKNTPETRNGLKPLKVLIILTVAFIWGHSMMSRTASSGESGFVFRLASPFLEIFLGKGNVTEHLIRKLAHFTEYFVLGVELAAYQLIKLRLKFFCGTENCAKKAYDTETDRKMLAQRSMKAEEKRKKEKAGGPDFLQFRKQLLPAPGMGLLVAAIDETIQVFSGRGPSVKDVLLDFSGVAAACIIVCIIISPGAVILRRDAKKTYDENTEAPD